MKNRRSFLQHALGLGAGLFAAPSLLAEQNSPVPHAHRHVPAGFNAPVITPDVGDLSYVMDNGVKVFRLTAQVIQQQVAPNKTIDLWGFNGSAPGPTIQVTQGDRVRIIVRNELPEPTSMHWHGFEDTIANDGMPGISQVPIRPGGEFTYEFNIHQEGTYFYHSHLAMQEMAGMLGAFIMHPRIPYTPHCDKDFALSFQEYWVLPNSTVPNTMNMEFNWLVINGKAGPSITPLIVRLGDRVRIRMINLGMDHHPIHVHGHTFHVTGTEGGRIQESAWWPGNTVLVGVAQARTIEFVANNPGDWMLHCHMPHHMMNQMASQAGPLTRTTHRSAGPAGALTGPLADTRFPATMDGMMQEMKTGEPAGDTIPMGPMQMRNMMAMKMDTGKQQADESAPNANNVPNYPQDAFMEGPMMQMDKLVDKPENHGLRPGWSQYMQGMMTFVRVLPPDEYDAVVALMQAANRPSDPYTSMYKRS